MNIRLRDTREDDLDFVLSAEQSAENRSFVSRWTRAQHLAALTSEDVSHLVIESVADGSHAGYLILAGLTDANRNLELRRIVVTEKEKGYGKEALRLGKKLAFGDLKAHRLWLDVKEHNVRARHVYESEGFVVEGVLRDCLKTETGYESLVLMSVLQREYLHPKASGDRIEEEITRLEREWIEAIRQQDASSLESIIADDCCFAGGLPEGQLADKRHYIEDSLRSVPEAVSYSYDRVRLRSYQETAIVNSMFKFQALVAGKEASGAYLLTDVWMKRREGWQVVMRHSSPLVNAAPGQDLSKANKK